MNYKFQNNLNVRSNLNFKKNSVLLLYLNKFKVVRQRLVTFEMISKNPNKYKTELLNTFKTFIILRKCRIHAYDLRKKTPQTLELNFFKLSFITLRYTAILLISLKNH